VWRAGREGVVDINNNDIIYTGTLHAQFAIIIIIILLPF